LSFKKINDDGTLEDFPPDQLFNVGILSGDGDRGVLVSASGEVGTTLGRAPVPIRYVAPESIEGDTLIVSVIATAAFSSGSSAASVKSTGKHAIPSARSTAAGLDSALIQTQKKAELESVRAKLIAQAAGTCSPGKVTIAGVEPELVLDAPRGLLSISRVPRMPTPADLAAQFKNFTGGDVNFYWDLIVEWTGPNGRHTKGVYTGQGSGLNSTQAIFPIDWEGLMRGGDQVALHFVAVGGRHRKEATIQNPFKIVGLNPFKENIRAMLTLEEQVLAYLESKFRQFKQDGDFPLWGYPDGWGIMQVDPPSNDDQLWDWTKNVAEGKRRFQHEKVELARTYAQRVRNGRTWYKDGKGNRKTNDPIKKPWEWYKVAYENAEDLSEDEMVNEMFQRYNGGVFFRWEPDDPNDVSTNGSWIRLQDITKPRYGDTGHAVYTVVRKVYNGELPPEYLPPGWN